MAYRKQGRRLLNYGIRKALQYGPRVYKAYRQISTANKNTSKSMMGVSQHHDSKLQYRKRRMPYRKKRNWKKFVKKVQAANERSLGTKTIVFNKSVTGTSTAANAQNWMIANLYGTNGTSAASELGAADLYQIFQQAYLSSKETQKLTFKSAVLDITLTNTGTTKLEVDLYVLSYWGEPAYGSFSAAASGADNTTPVMNPNGSGFFSSLNISQRGVTLFDMPELIRNGKFTIQKKVKYWIDVSDTATFQIRDPKSHMVSETEVLQSAVWGTARLTQSIFVNFKPVAGATDTGNSLTMGATRKYSLNSVDAEDADGWVNY